MNESFFKRMKERWLHIVYGILGRLILNLIGYTCRYNVSGFEQFIQTASKNKCILMFWHNRLMMIAEILYRHAPQLKYAALISNSKDGEVISVLTNSYKQGRSIRVPHNARSAALQTLIKEMKNSDDVIIITPDGPRGPAYSVKPGIVLAAKKASAQVIPLTWSASRYWKLPTWDGLILPKPFSTIEVKLGIPLSLSEGNTAKVKDSALKLEDALLSLENYDSTEESATF